MSRPQRIIYEDAWYHVMNRGAGRRKIFNDRADREIFLETLGEACHQFCIEVHAYCLMGNHYHLLLKTPQANLSRAMRHINGVYTQRYNRSNKTDGSLFRGRYQAILVDSDAYLLHLNPKSDRMVDSPSTIHLFMRELENDLALRERVATIVNKIGVRV